jgi:hypothetical protein
MKEIIDFVKKIKFFTDFLKLSDARKMSIIFFLQHYMGFVNKVSVDLTIHIVKEPNK